MINLGRRKQAPVTQELNLTAMCDVIFLILIYMMFTAKPDIIFTVFEINKPAADKRITSPPPRIPMVEIIVMQEDYTICGKRVNADGIGGVLQQLARADKDQTIIVKCTPDAAHERLMRILDLCSRADLRSISVMSM